MEIRNIAIIAHVDHGKTTLVDKILHATKVFRENQETGDLIMDSNDLERERGITIFSKNASVTYKDVKINVIDTPGHSDFGGEVERVLKMADGVLLLVDAFEGPMPQTRFVLQKALHLNLKPIVVINKVDKPNCRPDEVHDAVFELFFNLDATEEQLDFPTFYGSGKNGWFNDKNEQCEDITPLLDGIIKYVPPPAINEGFLQMQITSLDYSSFLGRIAIGKVARGVIKEGQTIALMQADGTIKRQKVRELYVFEGMGKRKVTEVICGDLCAVVGLEGFNIGDTIADIENPEALAVISVDEPTMSMLFSINNSPFFGRDGKFVTSRHLRDRRMNEKVFINKFIKGSESLLSVAFIVGLARGVTIILNEGRISDSILFYASHVVDGTPPALFIISLLALFLLLTIFISSSSGMAVLTMPIIAPLGIVAGVGNEHIVNAYLFGMGIMNIITPTGLALPALTMVNVSYKTWIKFMTPLMIILTVVSIVYLIVTVMFF